MLSNESLTELYFLHMFLDKQSLTKEYQDFKDTNWDDFKKLVSEATQELYGSNRI